MLVSTSPAKASSSSTSAPTVSLRGDFTPLAGSIYFGGYLMMLIHFCCINVGIIDSHGVMGTGTTTVLSWCAGWLIKFYWKVVRPYQASGGGSGWIINRGLRYELVLVLAQLFVLAVGAGAFSRFYYGWLAGREEDIFQSLSIKYLARSNGLGFGEIDEAIAVWWKSSVTSRFSGLGWWVCEFIDPLFHQVPVLGLGYLTFTHPTLQHVVSQELVWGGVPLIALVSIVGPAQRFFWDLSTCGTTVCDGPYHGFLSHISPYEQMFWHTAPGILFCMVMFGFYRWYGRKGCAVAVDVEHPFKEVMRDIEGHYSVFKTLAFIVVWGFGQVAIARVNGGEVFKEGWWWIEK